MSTYMLKSPGNWIPVFENVSLIEVINRSFLSFPFFHIYIVGLDPLDIRFLSSRANSHEGKLIIIAFFFLTRSVDFLSLYEISSA